jgi:glycine betaine/proline transport system ATP-binding protein
MAIIETRDLCKRYGQPKAKKWFGKNETADGTLAVNNVSFSIDKGELFVIMGLSESGKSTVLRMLNRLVEPTSGSVTVDGKTC